METTRVDRWLWAVRVYRTRTEAAEACRGGHVRVNGAVVKPSRAVGVGDRLEARVGDRHRIVEVTQVIERRVGAPAAAECLVDHSPPPPPQQVRPPGLTRPRGSGRPTKRDRRRLDRIRDPRG